MSLKDFISKIYGNTNATIKDLINMSFKDFISCIISIIKVVWRIFWKLLLLSIVGIILLILFLISWDYYENNFSIESLMREKFYKKIDQTISDGKDSFYLRDADLDFEEDFKWDRVCYVTEWKAALFEDNKVITFLNAKGSLNELQKDLLYDTGGSVPSYTGLVLSDGKTIKSFNAQPSNLTSSHYYYDGCCGGNEKIDNLFKFEYGNVKRLNKHQKKIFNENQKKIFEEDRKRYNKSHMEVLFGGVLDEGQKKYRKKTLDEHYKNPDNHFKYLEYPYGCCDNNLKIDNLSKHRYGKKDMFFWNFTCN